MHYFFNVYRLNVFVTIGFRDVFNAIMGKKRYKDLMAAAAIGTWIVSQIIAVLVLTAVFHPSTIWQFLVMVPFTLIVSLALNRVSFVGVRRLAAVLKP